MSQKTLNVHIGEIKIARKGEMLKAILGSCVGIAVIWREKKLCGLAHCLLSENPEPTFEIGGRFVDQAIPSMMALMKIKKEDLPQIEVVVVGGGNMTARTGIERPDLIGAVNFRVALRELNKAGLKIVHSDGGGEVGRKIFVDSSTCGYRVEKIPRIDGVA